MMHPLLWVVMHVGAQLLALYVLYNFPARGFPVAIPNPFLSWLYATAPKPSQRSVASDDTLNEWIRAGTGETLAEFVEADPHKSAWNNAYRQAEMNREVMAAIGEHRVHRAPQARVSHTGEVL